MRSCAFCPVEASRHLRMRPVSGQGLRGRISVCPEHVARVEEHADLLMAAIHGQPEVPYTVEEVAEAADAGRDAGLEADR